MKKTLVHWSGIHRKLEEGADRNIQGWKKSTLANEDCGNAVVIDHNICCAALLYGGSVSPAWDLPTRWNIGENMFHTVAPALIF